MQLWIMFRSQATRPGMNAHESPMQPGAMGTALIRTPSSIHGCNRGEAPLTQNPALT